MHVARADLDYIGVFLDKVEGFVVYGFGDDAEAIEFADFCENFQAGVAETLEAVGRGAGFVGATSEEVDACGLELLGDGEALLLSFDCAGASDHGEMRSTDKDIAGGSGNADDSGLGFYVEAYEFVGLGYGNAFDDAGHGFEDAKIDSAVVTGDADGSATGAGNRVGFEAEGFDFVTDRTDLFFGSVRLHNHKHERVPLKVAEGKVYCTGARAGKFGEAVSAERWRSGRGS